MEDELRARLATLQVSPEKIAARTGAIHTEMLRESPNLRQGDFHRIGSVDLARLFDRYDRSFFAGGLRRLLAEEADGRLALRLSTRMNRAGGRTLRLVRTPPGQKPRVAYEIAASARLLFLSFGDGGRPITVCGLDCRDRLQALQRVFEHELIHLLELLLWSRSSCKAEPFRALATGIFGHRATTHDLVTPVEHARVTHAIGPGARVTFIFEGRRYQGFANRIAQRATVLVEDEAGKPFSDGKRYRRFYVPLAMLQKIDTGPPPATRATSHA